jgi:hypothetical protein
MIDNVHSYTQARIDDIAKSTASKYRISASTFMLAGINIPYNIMIAGIPFVLTGQLKTSTPHYIHFF